MIENKKNYLLIPSVPTPNGRLHLGHIGGPFLSVDILARSLRVCGHRAWIISGTDSYESYAAGKAEEENKDPEQIGHHYHALIAEDLKLMNIQVDQFINPLAAPWSHSYQEWHEKIFQQLLNNKATSLLKENIPWDEVNKRYLTGYWLHGNCPVCFKQTTSYFCENCGAHFRPEEIIQENNMPQKVVENIFLHLPHQVDLRSKGVNQYIETMFQNYCMQQNNLFRITTHCDWGLPDPSNPNNGRTLFSYGFIFAYFLMFGELAGKLMGINKNAFANDSDVITISSFGIDNALPFLSSALGVSQGCPQYKSFDYYLVNYFYYLEGSKFSTSRQHMIGVEEAIHRKKLSSDIIRLYLASLDVRNQTGNFVINDFVLYYNKTIDWIETLIIQGMENLVDTKSYFCDQHLKTQLYELFAIQAHSLQPNCFLPHIAVHSIENWLPLGKGLHQKSGNYFWWLKGLTLLIYPYMPELGKALWSVLGYDDLPVMSDFFVLPARPLQKLKLRIKRIEQEFGVFKEEVTYEPNAL
ncbi:methionine--tRNA ligase [Legionella cincinnatiensis]|uniref:Methionyl-tRNA synthetase n=1 Tax=Legionella cincinnatiensis TaxID=28085 RepID=A0A378IH72_9GAMM|nr:methionine--tRNA ligase [Legionella cincinnatiensis]KTC86231.1 methionyl-tRNA synthetase [Legionella cincinnatiensis]STX33841.1 methionyl-tRNA synthetase [Legionella cincinnatiensis]